MSVKRHWPSDQHRTYNRINVFTLSVADRKALIRQDKEIGSMVKRVLRARGHKGVTLGHID